MVSPPIYTKEFLLVCLQYEYLKNKKNIYQVYANMCQMSASKCIRSEVTAVFEGDAQPGSSRSDSSDSTGEGPSDSVNTSKRSRSKNPDSSGEVERKRRKVEVQEEEKEDDVKIRIVSFGTMRSLFIKFRTKITPTEDEIDFKEIPAHFAQLLDYCYTRPSEGNKCTYNQIKSTIDFHKVKLHLSISETDANFHAEHWDDVNGGCWMWSDDNVRFIEDLSYEYLAANHLVIYIRDSSMPLGSLEFDIEERTKWSPNQDHSAAFWCQVKEFDIKVGAKKFSMKVLKCRDRTDCPYRLRYLNVGKVEEIKLRVWDDSYLRHDPPRIRYLNNFSHWDQWKNATILDIEDPNLSSINPDISSFELVKRQFISLTDERIMREYFKRNEEWKKCVVASKEPLRLNRKMTKHAVTYAESKFRITIEEFKVTYEMIDSNTPK